MVILVEAVGEEGTQKEASEAKSYAAQVDTPGPEENTNEEFPTDDNNNTSRISSTGDDRDFLSTQSSSNSKDDQGMSAQDAALHTEQGRAVPADFSVIVHDDNSSTSLPTSSPSVASSELSNPRLPVLAEESLSQKSRRTSKRLIRGRHHGRSRVALIDVCETKRKGLPTPSNQYECILIRRAVLPLEPKNSKNIGDVTVEVQDDVYGDISLGMKLSVADTGHVIVQRVTRLADGRASPAQLTGMIQRGDVLLAIDGVSLTENALAGLSPLRAPDDRRVPCQRQYKLRFAAAEGLSMLKSIENQRASISAGNAGNLASELLALFPMVDQLSGMPLFEEQHDQENQRPAVVPLPEAPPEIVPDATPSRKKVEVVPLDEQISESLSTLRVMDRNQYLLNCKDMSSMHAACTATEQLFLTLPQRQEMGRKALIGARNLINQVENIDAGKDLRSFQSWNTTLSLYSRASTRRRRVFDTASLPVNFGRLEEDKEDDDDSCAGSEKSSTNSEQLDGDELLLRLAAHDEIWRKQVIEFLEKVAQESNDSDSDDSNDVKEAESSDINLALSNELGSFLFGENMSKILAKHKTPRALPSEEVTAVLFDLATKLSASVPDEIKASGTIMTSKSRLTPISGLKRHAADSDAVLAARFLLDSALPAWLKSFRPLAWEHRRILWPVDRVRLGGSTAASTLSDDSLTVDSSQSTSARHRKRKNLREIIEDQELTIETRGETCFLTTFYFIHALLPRLMVTGQADVFESEKARDAIVVFLEEYGSYLRLDTCLTYAAVLKADTVVDLLLSIAKRDPRHREMIKQTTKTTSMLFYEPTMLSAVLQLLQEIQKETTHERKQAIIDLCASAYPDVRPWQVDSACRVSEPGKRISSEDMSELYYTYLSLLLHPMDGHDSARRDPSLVKEWCELSVKGLKNGLAEKSERRTNFFSVASRASSNHLAYHRDLLFLLTLSMEIKEHNLVLDLAGEILDDPILSTRQDALDLVLQHLRLVGVLALDSVDESGQSAARTLRHILRLYSNSSFRQFVDVPAELARLLVHREKDRASCITTEPRVLELIRFFADEAIPGDALKTLALCDSSLAFQPELLPVLHTILARGAATGCELSTSLLRIKRARLKLGQPFTVNAEDNHINDCNESSKQIWKRMARGMVVVEK